MKKRPVIQVSGPVSRLAYRLGFRADVLAEQIPPDTLRRTKYPVIEEVDEETGKVTYRPITTALEEPRPLIRQ